MQESRILRCLNTGFTLTPETVRFMQFPAAGKTTTLMTDTFGDKDITVVEVSAADASDTD